MTSERCTEALKHCFRGIVFIARPGFLKLQFWSKCQISFTGPSREAFTVAVNSDFFTVGNFFVAMHLVFINCSTQTVEC